MPRAQATDRDAGSYDSREGGGRVVPGAATESNAGAVAGSSYRVAGAIVEMGESGLPLRQPLPSPPEQVGGY